jgi:mono/diheme cytochrome c family protein
VGCLRCHGPNGQDGTEGPPLAPDPIPLREFTEVVRDGKGGGMPPFDTAKLEDTDLEAIYSFLKSVQ